MGCNRSGGVYKYRRPEPCAQKGSWSTLPVCRCPGPTSFIMLLPAFHCQHLPPCQRAFLEGHSPALVCCKLELASSWSCREDGCVCPRRLEWDDCVLHLSPTLIHKMSFLLPAVMCICLELGTPTKGNGSLDFQALTAPLPTTR